MTPAAAVNLVGAVLGCNMDTGPWIAGSAAAQVGVNRRPTEDGGAIHWPIRANRSPRDIDVFFRDAEQLAAARAILEAAGFVATTPNGTDSETCGDADETLGRSWVYTYADLQVNLAALTFWPSAQAVIDHFDFTVCQGVTDGRVFLLGATTVADENANRLVIVRETRTERVTKYLHRKGYWLPAGELFTAEDVPGRWRANYSLVEMVRALRGVAAGEHIAKEQG